MPCFKPNREMLIKKCLANSSFYQRQPDPENFQAAKSLEQYLRQLSSRNWFKNGMNHAQAGNLLKNLV
jgi:hypothetical protein